MTTRIFDDRELHLLRRELDLVRLEAVLGDDGGVIDDDPVNRPGYWRYRVITAAGLSLPPIARLGMNVSVPKTPGQPIFLGWERGELVIKGANVVGQIAAGLNPNFNNAAKLPEQTFIPTSAIVPLSSGPTSPPSLSVWVASLIYVSGRTVYHYYASEDGGAGTPKGRVNLTASIPAAGYHRLAGLFLKTDNTIEVSPSTAKAMDTPIDADDIQACLTGSSRLARPSWLWYLHDAQTTIVQADSYLDFRQWVNDPRARRSIRIVTAAGDVTVTSQDDVVVIDKDVPAATNVTLPTDAAEDDLYTVKDGSGTAATYNITVVGTIDNATNYVQNANLQSNDFIYDGTQWRVI